MQETTTLPLSSTAFGLVVLLVVIAFATLLAVATKANAPTDPSDSSWQRFLARIGLERFPPTVALFGGAFWLILALTLAGGILATIFTVPSAFTTSINDPEDPTLRWTLLTLTAMTGALGAVVAVPFTLIRIRQTQKQTDLQDEALFNDKINAAATDLAARRQITRVLHDGTENESVALEWEDDLVTRAAAIDRLEGLALERADVAPRIARMLSIYVQELSRAHPAETPPEEATPEELREWAETLTPIRPDMERAVQSLGRINPKNDDARAAFGSKNIDLRHCNLQAFDLRNLNFQGAQLGQAKMQKADLSGAQMQMADVSRAQMQEAKLIGAKLQRARLSWAQMQGANLSWAQMHMARLGWAQMQGADLSGAEMQGANLFEVKMQGTKLLRAEMQGANLFEAEMQGANLYRAQLQGANLRGAEMQGADLRWAEMDISTEMTGAALRGVTVISVDDTTLSHLQAHSDWPAIFHQTLDSDDFVPQWRAFAAALNPPVTIAPDYND